MTATNKVDKGPLRRARWIDTGSDSVYWRPQRRDPLRALTEAGREEIRSRFESNGRVGVLSR